MNQIILTLLISFTSQASELKDRFMATTGVREGRYELVKGDANCQQGPVSIVDLNSELTLMLGAKPLVLSLGQENSTSEERGCKSKMSGRFDKQHIQGEVEYTCKKLGKTVTKVDVTIQGDELTYLRRSTRKDKTQTESCSLKRISTP